MDDKLKYNFLDKYIFYGLSNLNNGFDAPSIFYFSETEFQKVLNRVKHYEIGIFGIETWKNGEFYDVMGYEEFSSNPSDSHWYLDAFQKFKQAGEILQYSATYFVQDDLLKEIK
jgi:hypothetical protein